MGDETLDKLLEYQEHTVSQVIYEGVKRDGLDNTVYGIKEVKDNLVSALNKASYLSLHNYIPLLLLIGPSASGKSEIIKGLKKSYYHSVREGARLFTIVIDGEKCPYEENAFNIFRSDLPFELDLKNEKVKSGQEICSKCLDNLAKVSKKDLFIEALKKPSETNQVEHNSLEDRLKIREVVPQLANIDLGDPDFKEHFYDVVKNANRGILLISADKSKLSDIDLNNYQFLINLYDNNVFDPQGNKIPLDMLVVIHTNENFADALKMESGEGADESAPLKERLISVRVRRNLSFTQEEKIYQVSKLPINRIAPSFLRYLAIANVMSRLNFSLLDDRTPMQLDNLMEVLDMYDSGTLSKTNAISKSLDIFLQNEEPAEVDLNEKVKKMISNEGEYNSGWSQGLSTRLIKDLLKDDTTFGKRDLAYFDMFDFLENNIENVASESRDTIKEYLSGLVHADIRSNLDYGILSVLLKYEDIPFATYISNLQEYLVSEEPQKILPKLGKLQDFIDIEDLRKLTKVYAEVKLPENRKPIVEIRELLRFGYRYSEDFHFLKKEPELYDDLQDDKSKLHRTLKEVAEKELGYWDKCFKQALEVYINGSETLCQPR